MKKTKKKPSKEDAISRAYKWFARQNIFAILLVFGFLVFLSYKLVFGNSSPKVSEYLNEGIDLVQEEEVPVRGGYSS